MNEDSLQQVKAQFDTEVKKLLAQKTVLAWILRKNVREFHGMELQNIIRCIENDPEIGIKPVNPGKTNSEITGISNEDSVPGEGTLYYDIIFYVKVPNENGVMKMLINVEAQKSFYPGYRIETRAVFYAAREISAQKHTEFEKSDYDSIKKVYSIWLCMNAPESIGNAISEYSFCKKDVLPGIPDRKEAYDKMVLIIVTLNETIKSTDQFINFMNMLISMKMSVEDKKKRIEQEFGITVNRELEERMNVMCNYSDLIEERGIARGESEGIKIGRILAYAELGMHPDEIAKRMTLEIEEVEKILEENGALSFA